MKIEVTEAARKDEPVLERLFQLYQYDFSEVMDDDAEDDGVFRFISLGKVWDDDRTHAYIARVDGLLAGATIVVERSHFTGDMDVAYMDGTFDERVEDSDKWIGPVQTFDARERVGA